MPATGYTNAKNIATGSHRGFAGVSTWSSIRDHVQGDDRQDAPRHQSRPGDEQRRQMCAGGGERLQSGLPKLLIATPAPQHRSASDDERRQRQRDEEDVEAQERPGTEPVDQAPGALGGFIGRRLKIPHEERGHEQRGWEDEEELRSGEGALDGVHGYFVMQSSWRVKGA